MSENEETQEMAGRAVEGAGNAVETVANQVESAAVEATEFASDNVLGRLIGYVRAGKNITTAGLQGGLDFTSESGDILLRELDELRETVESEMKKAAGDGSTED